MIDKNLSLVLALWMSAPWLVAVAQPGPAGAQAVSPSIRATGPVIDLADVPLNRTSPKLDWERVKDSFFPSLLGLRTSGLKQIRTRHFSIYYTSAENTARRIAEIADETFDEISSYYPTSMERYAPMHVVVDDGVDVLGNAYAVYSNNLIHFWATPLDWEIRGTKDWVKDVFTHELTHIITLKAAHQGWPFSYGRIYINQSNENPDFNLALPLYHLALPNWFTEGIAQYESLKHGGDFWDTHRDMLLRMATLEDDLLSYTNMGVFSKDGHHSEMVYNQGFALLNYVDEKYGEDKVRAMAEKRPIVNFKSAVKKSVGISAGRLYSDWVDHLRAVYGARADSILALGEREGVLIYDGGSLDYHPVYSPDGTKVAFLSNGDSDYSLMTLHVMDLSTRRIQDVAKWDDRPYPLVSNRFSWTPDGDGLVYNRSVGGRWDVFCYDLIRKEERRITAGLRGRDPAVSPDGERIAYVRNFDGTKELGIIDFDGSNARVLTYHNDGTQYYGPKWSPDGSKILFSVFRGEDRDIAVIDSAATSLKMRWGAKKKRYERAAGHKKGQESAEVDSTVLFPDSLAYANNAGFEALLRSKADERDPVWLPDGSGFVFSSDRGGVFNLYSYDLATGRQEQITNVIGGAFSPTIAPDGQEILYAGFHAANYSLYRIPRSVAVAVAPADIVTRDYRNTYTGDKLSELYDVGRGSSMLTTKGYGITPVLLLGPTFIGNRFGLDQLSLGIFAAWGGLLSDDYFVTGATVGKNLKRRTDLNSNLFAYYETGLTPLFTEQKAYAPRFFIGASRQTINSLIDHGVIASQRDTTSGTLITVIDSQQVLIPNTTQFLNLSLTEEDEYKDVFSDFIVGTEVGLGRSHSLTLMYGIRSYSENLRAEQVILDSTRIFQAQADNGGVSLVDITDEIPGASEEVLVMDDFLYRDLNFFRSSNLTAAWRYARFKPTKDMFVNPTSGRVVSFAYRRINATITDSLALSRDLDQDNVPDPTDIDVSPTIFRADDAKLGANEFLVSWNEFIPMPGRTTLAVQAFLGYKDRVIKEVQQDGGTFEGVFYYPLRYYLGGLGTLRGYPYFTMAGGKAVFGRASFTFPIFQRADKELPPFFFDKIYGTLFVETGATGNFDSLGDMTWPPEKDAFLTDFGLELRMQMFSHYRLPMFGYFVIAFPTKRNVPDRSNPNIIRRVAKRRIYFGFTI